MTVRNVKQHNNTRGLGAYTTDMLEAELESRKSATHTSVYERAGVSEGNEHLFDDVCYAICTEGLSITEVSTPERAGYITGNAKNWVRNLGGLSAFKDMFVYDMASTPLGVAEREVTALDVCRDYLQSRKDAGTGFTTRMFLEQIGTYEGKPFGVVVKDDNVGTRYVIGALRKDEPQAFKHTTRVYKNVDKATKGQRMKVDYLVFDPVG